MSSPRIDQPFVVGVIDAQSGQVPRVSSVLTSGDYLGSVKVRFGIGRMDYTVDPGLYALGNPGADDHVFVSANYKLSFDMLRKALSGRDGWILVLDTKGVNVWCAAGKGTFGTDELVGRIASSKLGSIVSHRTLILPQLAAPGVASFEIQRRSGFRVIYGPIESSDLPAFIDAGLKATSSMRTKSFTLGERLVLIPIEVMGAVKIGFLVLVSMFLVSVILSGLSIHIGLRYAYNAMLALFLGVISGAIVTPVLLPWLPGRAFAFKGLMPGIVGALTFFLIQWPAKTSKDFFELFAWILSIIVISTYLAMNFTGSSTYTSLSGVRKEMRIALPLQILGATCGLALWIVSVLMR